MNHWEGLMFDAKLVYYTAVNPAKRDVEDVGPQPQYDSIPLRFDAEAIEAILRSVGDIETGRN